ncbi:sugar ABC transporter substrate-binding protein [Cellulomonas sp. WB94]|uniref:multiple monosaccharide ABC transporter substrate-binding protein n=1 Tax=Cellulomonas sp. WB94 TaxID=2173174 RepID=UPI000D58616D|nr:multiple monosaccharide ABC transporter substrate-binding protein [Cellulomonas sp. WB94]PVU82498.1 sugar ABC transporter substrate-binding protein [Cellulomonas sp. WB94]
MRIKHVAAIAAAFTLTLGLAACSGGGAGTTAEPSTSGSAAAAAPAAEGALVGVAMPTKSSERWIADGNNVKTQLEALGYKVDLQYAEDDIPTQVNQIDTMITKGAKLLIIASIDGTALTSQLEQAHANGIQVIAYDRLIRNSANVDYYSTFDNFKVGVQQATSLLTGLGVLDASGKDAGKTGPLNVELFAGSPDDNNATFFFNGAMSILQPYIDSKVLVVKSGQTDFKTVATLRWDPATAQSRMENLLTSTYSDGSLVSGVLSPYDGLSIGILGALKGVGYGTASQPWPIVTGQDAEAASVKSIIAGEQYSTIYKDTRELAKVTVAMTDAILKGNTPEVTDTKTYDNGVKVVPSYLLDSQIIVKDNYKKVLVDGGYYTEADLS